MKRQVKRSWRKDEATKSGVSVFLIRSGRTVAGLWMLHSLMCLLKK
ncbi:hypothetical protein HMPREF0294_1005 [Corynebacterium glucuronolyticum ATCC 51867]|uniref:Uncharacterized protein n=1 Tax=Corynebacterium glucuronolyticum ATCC 51866 TaxID=548478 RepID=A0ABM9XND9_9CORY|nr:hypothetical protein HMPREF0294_1005 [Corynebacterium glucuronolyticum ATCC 51867]EEI62666.1 hypothetical protein HMPREF0293_1815 [Corynebacterium glucuronolyticum ATCC 51866]